MEREGVVVEFRVLGPLEVAAEGRPLPLGGLKQRLLLALLLLERNHPVSPDRLIDALWDEHPPASAANSVQVYVSRLRRTLAAATDGSQRRLLTEAGCYLLRAADEEVDAAQFERLLREGSDLLRSGEAVRAEATLARALGLWRGRPFADFPYETPVQAEVVRLEELRLRAVEEQLEALLALGRHSETVSELQALVVDHPFEERLRAQLMLALYRSGRASEALAAYRDLRRALTEGLGVEPTSELRALERAILRQDPELAGGVPAEPATASPLSRRERKLVTVLIAAFETHAAELADPEELEAVASPHQRRLAHEVESCGGTLMNVLGDVTAAVFGVPTAHDDDAERAVRSALALRDAVAETGQVEVTVAIEAGEALVTGERKGGALEPGLTGPVVTAALRLQAGAPGGAVLVGPRAYAMTRDTIEFRDAPSSVVGAPVWEAVRERADGARENAQTPFVGRDHELGLLASSLARVRETRKPALVVVTGDPGVGKTRLVHEFVRVTEREPDIGWHHGRSLPYGDGVSFWALAQIVKTQVGILASDSSETAGAKLAQAVGEAVGEDDANWVLGHLRPLVGLTSPTTSTGERRDEVFAAWRAFFGALASRRRLVLVLEDLHWADDGLLDFVQNVVEWLEEPLLVVATARPEFLERRPGWSQAGTAVRPIRLTPLTDEQTGLLLDHLGGQSHLSAAARSAVVAKVGGNPLYAEQFARLLSERGDVEALPLPDTVRATIAARLDALPAGERALLQSAAVFSKVFWTGAAAAVEGIDRHTAEARLHALERKRLVQRVTPSSVAGESEYAFSHALLRDVSYAQLTRPSRAEAHDWAAAWLESLGGADAHSEVLAHHYATALELRRAGGEDTAELLPRVRSSLIAAGERAFALQRFDAAARFFERALKLVHSDDPTRPRLLFRYGSALRLGGYASAEETLERAREALIAAGERETAAETDTQLAELWWHRGERQRLERHLERALELLDDQTSGATRARVLETIARFAGNNGRDEAAVRAAADALAIAESLDLPELVARSLITLGTSRWHLGDQRGAVDIQRGIDVAITANAFAIAPRGYDNLASVLARNGDPTRPSELLRQAQALRERFGRDARYERASLISYDLFLGGDWNEALRRTDEFIEEIRAGRPYNLEHELRSVRAAIALARGDVETALSEYEHALELARRVGAESLRRQLAENARAHAELGSTDKAEALAREVVDLGPCARGYWAWNVFPLAVVADRLAVTDELLQLLGPPGRDSFEEAVLRGLLAGDFAAAADMMAASGRRTREALLRLEAGRSLIEQGRRTEASAQLEQALSFYRSVRATRYIAHAEELLSEPVAEASGTIRARW